MPSRSKASLMRFRSSPATSHCFIGLTVPRTFSSTPESASAFTRSTAGGSRIFSAQSPSAASSRPTVSITVRTRSRSSPYPTETSRLTRAKLRVRLDEMRTSPFGIVCRIPSRSRSTVRRRFTDCTVPPIPAMLTTSPAAYWFSSRTNMPPRRSRTRVCAPKPIASPTTPAPAISGPSWKPASPSAIDAARRTTVTSTARTSTWERVAERFACSSSAIASSAASMSSARWRASASRTARGIVCRALQAANSTSRTSTPIREP